MLANDCLLPVDSESGLKDIMPHHYNNTNVRIDPPRLRYFDQLHEPTMPLEFSVAAYRFGHSMVRPGYRLSETIGPLFIFDTDINAALTGFREFPVTWAIDWNLFMDLVPRDPVNTPRTQLAYIIHTSLLT